MFSLRTFICVTKCWIVWKFFFFLDCLRRTKGYELLILEYQNVVETKVGCTIIFIAARWCIVYAFILFATHCESQINTLVKQKII